MKIKLNFGFLKRSRTKYALNKGFARCTGDIYGWLNSDDVYLPDTFKIISSIFSKNKDKKIIFGDWLNIDIKDDIIDYNHAFDFN